MMCATRAQNTHLVDVLRLLKCGIPELRSSKGFPLTSWLGVWLAWLSFAYWETTRASDCQVVSKLGYWWNWCQSSVLGQSSFRYCTQEGFNAL